MLAELCSQWQTNVVRGPGWLFVRLREPTRDSSLDNTQAGKIADSVWKLMQSNLTRRVVLELDEVPLIPSELLGQLVELNRLVQSQGGLLRLSGVSAGNREVLQRTRLDDRLPQYRTREDAVMAEHRQKPK